MMTPKIGPGKSPMPLITVLCVCVCVCVCLCVCVCSHVFFAKMSHNNGLNKTQYSTVEVCREQLSTVEYIGVH